MKSWLRPCFQVKLEINLCARISSALHRCLRETRVEELVCFSFSEGCVKTFEVHVLKVACSLIALNAY